MFKTIFVKSQFLMKLSTALKFVLNSSLWCNTSLCPISYILIINTIEAKMYRTALWVEEVYSVSIVRKQNSQNKKIRRVQSVLAYI